MNDPIETLQGCLMILDELMEGRVPPLLHVVYCGLEFVLAELMDEADCL